MKDKVEEPLVINGFVMLFVVLPIALVVIKFLNYIILKSAGITNFEQYSSSFMFWLTLGYVFFGLFTLKDDEEMKIKEHDDILKFKKKGFWWICPFEKQNRIT